jgi:hypothetical protein
MSICRSKDALLRIANHNGDKDAGGIGQQVEPAKGLVGVCHQSLNIRRNRWPVVARSRRRCHAIRP